MSGRGTPRRWSLHFWFFPPPLRSSRLAQAFRAQKVAGLPRKGVSLDECDWFKRLYVDRRLFSFGLQSLASKESGLMLAAEFEKLAKHWPRRGPGTVLTVRSRALARAPTSATGRQGAMQTLTMNIKRPFFGAIVAGTKRIEYRPRSCSGSAASSP